MIQVERPAPVPEVLLDGGQDETNEIRERYDSATEDYRTGLKKFDFRRSIYGHTRVKDALLEAQHGKCCYCESKFRATSPGAVEHFRPKGAVRAGGEMSNTYPGYYWLAYEWENLLVSCETCNTSKGTLFPLVDEDKRARCHHDPVEEESPVFVDPASEDPAQHICFRRAEVVHLTDRGLRTIEGFGLRRSELEEARAKYLEWFEALCLLTSRLDGKVTPVDVENARALLNRESQPEAKFSAMTRDYLGSQAGGVDSD